MQQIIFLIDLDLPSTINSSDLELCGNIAHHNIASHFTGITKRMIVTLFCNIVHICWLKKSSTTTTEPPAYLVQLQAYHQQFYQYLSLHDYIPGPANTMSDICPHVLHLIK